MTKIKKRLALLMALVMAMTMLALPASAATGEGEVEPRAAVANCPTCGAIATKGKVLVSTRTVTMPYCVSYDITHSHVIYTYDNYITCPNCGTINVGTTTTDKCFAG